MFSRTGCASSGPTSRRSTSRNGQKRRRRGGRKHRPRMPAPPSKQTRGRDGGAATSWPVLRDDAGTQELRAALRRASCCFAGRASSPRADDKGYGSSAATSELCECLTRWSHGDYIAAVKARGGDVGDPVALASKTRIVGILQAGIRLAGEQLDAESSAGARVANPGEPRQVGKRARSGEGRRSASGPRREAKATMRAGPRRGAEVSMKKGQRKETEERLRVPEKRVGARSERPRRTRSPTTRSKARAKRRSRSRSSSTDASSEEKPVDIAADRPRGTGASGGGMGEGVHAPSREMRRRPGRSMERKGGPQNAGVPQPAAWWPGSVDVQYACYGATPHGYFPASQSSAWQWPQTAWTWEQTQQAWYHEQWREAAQAAARTQQSSWK